MRAVRTGLLVAVSLALVAGGCARYQRREMPFRAATDYASHQSIDGADLGVLTMDDPRQARDAFGFDIVGAGVLPVQVVIDNNSTQSLHIIPDQSYLILPNGDRYGLLDPDKARERIASKTSWGEVGPQAGRGALLGGAGGVLIGGALGVVTGRNVLRAAGKGAVVGAAGGAVVGGAQGASEPDTNREIAQDLRTASLQNKRVAPGESGHGILFFPGEARGAVQLHLRLEESPSGDVADLTFSL
jgi:hypothetical protein